MNIAYVDTSCLVAIALDEPTAVEVADKLRAFDHLVSSNLLAAELFATLVREDVATDDDALLSWITWVLPRRGLSPELRRVLAQGFVRGADLWHLACALYVEEGPLRLSFLTLDQRQNQVARNLGFETLT